MFNTKTVLSIVILGIALFFCIRGFLKNLSKPRSSWQKILPKLQLWKLIVETYVISFAFYISVRCFGLFGTDLTEVLKQEENLRLFEASIFIIVPVLLLVFAVLMLSVVLSFLPYSPETKRYIKLVSYFLVNKIYVLIVLANILSKIF